MDQGKPSRGARGIGVIAVAVAVLAGCAVPPAAETAAPAAEALADGDRSAAGPLDLDELASPWEASCPAGAWITPPRRCACLKAGDRASTAECVATDCRESDLLLLLPSGAAFRATIRYSAADLRLSAAGGRAGEGTWRYYDDGELRLDFEGNSTYTPAECQDGALQMKAHPLMRRPPSELDEAIFRAWFTGEWTDVPYRP